MTVNLPIRTGATLLMNVRIGNTVLWQFYFCMWQTLK